MSLGVGIGIKYDTTRLGKVSIPSPPQVSVFASGTWNNEGTWKDTDTWNMGGTESFVASTRTSSTKKKSTTKDKKNYWNF